MKRAKKLLWLILSVVLVLSLYVPASAAPSTGKDVVIYYPNWACYNDVHQTQYVKDLPWDKVTTINHAFWAIIPETVDGKTTYPISTIDSPADFEMENNHFDAYAEKCVEYPKVSVLLSIGGWTKCGYFSEMASTTENRASFIQSCIDTIKEYPFLAGIDIDWEYPGMERVSEGAGDEGCPADVTDAKNYTALLTELRAAFDANQMTNKQITVCAPANPTYIVTEDGQVNQELAAVSAIVNRVNLMTYDLTGSYNATTGHQSNLKPNPAISTEYSITESVDFYLAQGVPAAKLNIGSPLYSRGWGMVEADTAVAALGAAGTASDSIKGIWDGASNGGMNPWFKVRQWEISEGFVAGYDEVAEAAYIYNNNPNSRYYQNFYTYDNERSLKAKLDYIESKNLSGLIVWDSSGDRVDAGYPMISLMAKELGIWDGTVPVYTPTEQDVGEKLAIAFPETVAEWVVGMPAIVKDQVVYYDGALYICTAAETYAYSENWNPTAWEAPNYMKIGTLRRWETGMTHIEFDEYVEYQGFIYQCTKAGGTDAFSENWNPTAWEAPNYTKIAAITISDAKPEVPKPIAAPLGYWSDDVIWNINDVAIYNGKVYKCIAPTHIAGGEHPETTWGYWSEALGVEADYAKLAEVPAWNDERSWPIGAIVAYNMGIYKCLAPTHVAGGEHPETTWGYWEKISSMSTLKTMDGIVASIPMVTDGQDLSYTVSKGETLWGIAYNYYGTMNKAAVNKIYLANLDLLKASNGHLKAGDVIVLPAMGLKSPVFSDGIASASGYYLVMKGDSLSKLAEKYYGDATKWTKILDSNKNHVKVIGKSPIIIDGQWLIIPQ